MMGREPTSWELVMDNDLLSRVVNHEAITDAVIMYMDGGSPDCDISEAIEAAVESVAADFREETRGEQSAEAILEEAHQAAAKDRRAGV
jgi:hypothetical protein